MTQSPAKPATAVRAFVAYKYEIRPATPWAVYFVDAAGNAFSVWYFSDERSAREAAIL